MGGTGAWRPTLWTRSLSRDEPLGRLSPWPPKRARTQRVAVASASPTGLPEASSVRESPPPLLPGLQCCYKPPCIHPGVSAVVEGGGHLACTSLSVPGGQVRWCVDPPPGPRRGGAVAANTSMGPCALWLTSGCDRYHRQRPRAYRHGPTNRAGCGGCPADPAALPRSIRPSKPLQRCPADCSGIGRCDYDTGTCRCPPGWQGPACSDRVRRRRAPFPCRPPSREP